MKYIICFLFIVIMIIGCSINDSTDTSLFQPTYPINIDLQNGFANDSVRAKISGLLVLSGTYTTDLSTGLAGGERFYILDGTYTLSVYIPHDAVVSDTTFVHQKKELWIGVNYDKSFKKCTFVFSDSAFHYR
jgi:hypothetical protein